MKKTMLALLLVLLTFFGACTSNRTSSTTDATHDKDALTHNKLNQEDTPMHAPINLQSYADLNEYTAQKNQEGELSQYSTGIANSGFPIPCVDGQPIALNSSEGNSSITVFSNELYQKPWIWYDSTIESHELTIRIMLNQDVLVAFDENDSCSAIIKNIAPDAPNIHNYQNFSGYSDIYELNITTADGAKVALVKKASDRNLEYISFVQNGFLVILTGPKDAITSEWLASFSITQSGLAGNDHVTE